MLLDGGGCPSLSIRVSYIRDPFPTDLPPGLLFSRRTAGRRGTRREGVIQIQALQSRWRRLAIRIDGLLQHHQPICRDRWPSRSSTAAAYLVCLFPAHHVRLLGSEGKKSRQRMGGGEGGSTSEMQRFWNFEGLLYMYVYVCEWVCHWMRRPSQ